MTAQRIFALFSTPLYVNNVGEFARPDFESLEWSSAEQTGGVYNFRTSADKKVLHRPEFKGVHDVVMKEVDLYAHAASAGTSSSTSRTRGSTCTGAGKRPGSTSMATP
jgi:hypothetical protein